MGGGGGGEQICYKVEKKRADEHCLKTLQYYKAAVPSSQYSKQNKTKPKMLFKESTVNKGTPPSFSLSVNIMLPNNKNNKADEDGQWYGMFECHMYYHYM